MRKPKNFNGDGRRKHHHFRVTVSYKHSGTFSRVYSKVERAENFARRAEKSPVVKSAQVVRLD